MNALTGFDYTEQELSQVGERIWNLERLYNLREGVEEDLPPVRFYQEAWTTANRTVKPSVWRGSSRPEPSIIRPGVGMRTGSPALISWLS